jgi:acyl dehydratase
MTLPPTFVSILTYDVRESCRGFPASVRGEKVDSLAAGAVASHREGVIVEPHYFEDFRVGAEYRTGERTIDDDSIRAFAELSGDFNPLHLDDEYAASTIYGGRIAHGVLGLAVATGLVSETHLTRGTLVAFAGLEWDFRGPLRPGDRVTARLRVDEIRRTSRGNRGLVRLAVHLVDQRGEVVQAGGWTFLVRCREAGPDRT